MLHPQITTVIPTKGRPELLMSAISSALLQTHQPHQIIVVDDNDELPAREATQKAVAEFHSEIVLYLPNNRTKGGAGARNTGILAAQSTYIAFLDDDDTWDPQKLARQSNLLRKDPGGLVFCGYIDDDRIFKKTKSVLPTKTVLNIDDLLAGECPTSTTLAVAPRSLLMEVGMFDESLPSLQDYDLWIRCAAKAKLMCVAEPLATFVQHHGARVSMNPEPRLHALEIVIGKLKSQRLISKRQEDNLRRSITASLYLSLAKRTCLETPLTSAFWAIKALGTQPTNTKCWKWAVASPLIKVINEIQTSHRKKM